MTMKKDKAKPETTQLALSLFPETTCSLLDLTTPLDSLEGTTEGSDPDKAFVESVRHLGILVPLIVQEVSGGAYKLVAGRRRLKAARLVGLDEVPIRVVPMGFANPETILLQENALRRANPVSEYRAIKSLIAKGYDQRQISKELGIAAAIIKQRLTFDRLNETLLDLAETGHIAASVALSAAKLPPATQETLVAKFQENDRLSGPDVAAAKKVVLGASTKGAFASLFKAEDKKKADAAAAVGHLDAAESLLKSLGLEVDLSTLRSEALSHI